MDNMLRFNRKNEVYESVLTRMAACFLVLHIFSCQIFFDLGLLMMGISALLSCHAEAANKKAYNLLLISGIVLIVIPILNIFNIRLTI